MSELLVYVFGAVIAVLSLFTVWAAGRVDE
jgi:hypothetical protein